eukprot:scaffold48664_cov42-Phaeocystis_antarctica.AAC.2
MVLYDRDISYILRSWRGRPSNNQRKGLKSSPEQLVGLLVRLWKGGRLGSGGAGDFTVGA